MDDDTRRYYRPQSNYDINSRIMITVIISLSFVVLLVILLHMYARYALSRRARYQATLRNIRFLTNTAEPPKTGLDPTIIASLPIFMFKQSNKETGSIEECAVCLNLLEDGEIARTLPNCKHTFHAQCIDQWLGSNLTCPICRTEAEPRLIAEPRERFTAPVSAPPIEGTSDGGGTQLLSAKISGSSSRLSSIKRILIRERSSGRTQIQSYQHEDGLPDVERQ